MLKGMLLQNIAKKRKQIYYSNTINWLIQMICIILCFSLLPTQFVLAKPTSSRSANIVFNTYGPFGDLFSWFFGNDTQLPEMPPFCIEKGHYVYRGGDLLTSYELDAPLYIESDMVVCSSISAKEIIIDASVNIASKNKDGKLASTSKLISKGDLKIKKSGSLSMDENTSIVVGRNLESKSNKTISLEHGELIVQGDLDLRNNWESSENCIVKVDGIGSHVLKGDNKCSVGMLVFSEDALYNSKIKKPFWFWQTEPEVFEVEKFSIKLSDSMIVKDNSSEISKILYCTPMQSNTPYHVTNFAKNYLYTVLYCNGDMGNVSIDIFDTFFNAKINGPQIDSVCFEDKKEVYLDAQKNPHCVKISLSYIGTRNSKDAKSIGFGEMIVKDEGQNYQFEFYPNLDNVDDDLNGFVASLRKGASEVIKDQAKDIVFGQTISDLADLSAPDMFDLEIGSVVCEADSMYEFLDELQSFTKRFNKMKNGLVLEPDSRMQVQATEEHAEAANTSQNEPVEEIENYTEEMMWAETKYKSLVSKYGYMSEYMEGTYETYAEIEETENGRSVSDNPIIMEITSTPKGGIFYENFGDYDNDGETEFVVASIREERAFIDVELFDTEDEFGTHYSTIIDLEHDKEVYITVSGGYLIILEKIYDLSGFDYDMSYWVKANEGRALQDGITPLFTNRIHIYNLSKKFNDEIYVQQTVALDDYYITYDVSDRSNDDLREYYYCDGHMRYRAADDTTVIDDEEDMVELIQDLLDRYIENTSIVINPIDWDSREESVSVDDNCQAAVIENALSVSEINYIEPLYSETTGSFSAIITPYGESDENLKK